MSQGALRGTRLGAASYESDAHVELAPRQATFYDCPKGHSFSLPFSEEADIPLHWECRCGAAAELRDGVFPELAAAKPARSHWDMLRERRSLEDLEELLSERLGLLRSTTGRPSKRKSA
ncbi:MAG: RNA polymerase-binding protein RbpA [Actinomycetes bacterium]